MQVGGVASCQKGRFLKQRDRECESARRESKPMRDGDSGLLEQQLEVSNECSDVSVRSGVRI